MTVNNTASLKQSLSVKMRNEVGDEVFISVGMEQHGVSPENVDAEQAALNDRLAAWIEERSTAVGGSAFSAASGGSFDEDETEEEAEEEADEEEEADGEEEAEVELTLEDVEKMKKAELDALIEEYELEIDTKTAIKAKRAAVIEALFAEDADEEEEADEEEAEEEEADDEAEGEEEEFEPYEEAELKAMKLAELQEIAEAWEVEVTTKKGADLKAKKAAHVKAILAFQEEAAEEE